MPSFNKVILLGNLTRDPQLKHLPSNTAVVEFGVACNRKFRTANGEDKEEVTFVDVTSFGKQAEVINQYFQKGKPIFIEGRLKFDSWEDKQGGGKRSKLTVVIENFQFVGDRVGGSDRGDDQREDYAGSRGGGSRANSGGSPPRRGPDEFPDDGPQFKDDDIPF
jgi:single-strand DNA-binding protein